MVFAQAAPTIRPLFVRGGADFTAHAGTALNPSWYFPRSHAPRNPPLPERTCAGWFPIVPRRTKTVRLQSWSNGFVSVKGLGARESFAAPDQFLAGARRAKPAQEPSLGSHQRPSSARGRSCS